MRDITVLMTTYNEEKEILSKAIESILNQTYKDFDFLIIVDCPSNLDNINLLYNYAKIDDRIRIVINEINLGLPMALNKGIELINSKYIARMDADDISLKNRLEEQLNFLKENKSISLIGSNVSYINNQDDIVVEPNKILENHSDIVEAMKHVNVFKHPTLFGKTEVFKNIKYRNLRYAQDYDFMCRVIEGEYYVANINKKLLLYRLASKENMQKNFLQELTANIIRKNYSSRKLNNIDINKQISKYKFENDFDILVAKKDIDIMLSFLNKKNIKRFFIHLALNVFKSKYHRLKIMNLIGYLFVKTKCYLKYGG